MLFVYGTLQDADVLRVILGRELLASDMPAAVAPGFRAVRFPGRVYPALIARADETAPGRVLLNLSHDDLAQLDAFEGDEYRRGEIGVVLADGREARAFVYVTVADDLDLTDPWSLADWVATHKAQMMAETGETAVALRNRLSAL
jgi:gamma-glutamylcyclotransferase (GGCT)/AIG2-like uncharacterized protein YtfP